MDNLSDRLRRARLDAGFKSAADAAEAFGWHVVTYRAHENGGRGVRIETLERYAAAFRVSPQWLITGKADKSATGRSVKVMGFVGAGAEVLAFANDEPWDGLDQIEAPAGTSEDAVAVIVRGDSMFPIFEDGELLIYSERRSDIDTFLFRTKPMIVQLRDGRILLKQIARGSKVGRYTLMSPNAPAIEDVQIEWVSRLDWTKPHR